MSETATTEAPRFYKVLTADGRTHGSGGAPITHWPLPVMNEDGSHTPGDWTVPVENPTACVSGWHLATHTGLIEWIREDAIVFLAEGRGDSDADGDDKASFSSARLIRPVGTLTPKALHLFAADCAERVLFIIERDGGNVAVARQAIEAARACARGEINREELDAARAAAWDAAGAAAGDAAWAAARAAAWAAAWDAAGAAAGAAAWAAAGAAAGAAERQWQADRLVALIEGDAA